MKKREQESKQPKKNPAEVKIGRILKQARLNRHYSLDDLHRITKIQKRYLKALELGDFSSLPGGFYIRAFIKTYANSVGLDGPELLRRFNGKVPDVHDPHYMNKISEDKLLIRAARGEVQKRHSTVRRYIPLVVMIIVIFIVLIGIWVVTAHYHNGLVTDSNEHSTSVSGMSSSSSVKHHRSSHRRKARNRRRVTISGPSKKSQRVIYRVSTELRPIRLRLRPSKGTQVTLKVSDQTSKRLDKESSVKLPSKAKSVQLSSNNLTRLKVNGKSVKLNHKQQTQLITLKFSK